MEQYKSKDYEIFASILIFPSLPEIVQEKWLRQCGCASDDPCEIPHQLKRTKKQFFYKDVETSP